ncbi:sensor histidine kinase [Croceimicrobium hydrocarbonivorans]|uniref:histidine kinase n=1 Tax=Croceimicrobium hydrocarbonivorans TaxID=2761580 RepID=A0A7H0VA90_9FLAO|nr:ATP-binding protein [Croceimicrobium hydrocarbonivorans]QNR22638.1 hypothetical protein H4K34_09590 [Croceimicrobium hydrocarbonivorans]
MRFRGTLIPLLSQLLLSLLFAWLLLVQHLWIFSALMAILWILNAYWLNQRLQSTERELQNALRNSEVGDYNFYWPEQKSGGSRRELYRLLNVWLGQLRQYKSQKQSQTELLTDILRQLPFHLILLEADGSLRNLKPEVDSLPGMRHHMSAEDWPQVFPYLKKLLESPNENSRLVQLRYDGEKQNWLIQKVPVIREGHELKLLVLSNQQKHFEEQENETLEKILHVLTHEIMNSVSPINSLADTLGHHLQIEANSAGNYELKEEQFQDLQSTASIIKRRSEGLMSFVERYARFARLPRLQKSEIHWPTFLAEVQTLAASELKDAGMELELRIIQGQRSLYADHDLMSQVLLNLIRNAMESMLQNQSSQLTLELDQGDGYHYLKLIDSGPAVEESMQDQIFLPFFSTKKRGSGIGLSLSRKIIMAHGGRLYLQQKQGYKAFCIDLPF